MSLLVVVAVIVLDAASLNNRDGAIMPVSNDERACGFAKLIKYSPSRHEPEADAVAFCDLPAGHLSQHHQGDAHGRRWFWNSHAHGIIRFTSEAETIGPVTDHSSATVLHRRETDGSAT